MPRCAPSSTYLSLCSSTQSRAFLKLEFANIRNTPSPSSTKHIPRNNVLQKGGKNVISFIRICILRLTILLVGLPTMFVQSSGLPSTSTLLEALIRRADGAGVVQHLKVHTGGGAGSRVLVGLHIVGQRAHLVLV